MFGRRGRGLGACSLAEFSSAARQWAGEIVVLQITNFQRADSQEGADGRGDGAGKLVVVEEPAAVGGQHHTKTGRERSIIKHGSHGSRRGRGAALTDSPGS